MTLQCIVITPAHNEEEFIERTCESIVAQTLDSLKWIVVDDASTDRTAAIVASFQKVQPDRIELLSITRPSGRDFRNKVRAFDVGLARARQLEYRYVGNLDADISLDARYYETMLERMEAQPQLGIAGGMVASMHGGRFVSQRVSLDSVAGAVQLFKKACFDDIGGYRPLPLGGVDAAAEITARMKGWKVRTFDDIQVLEHRRTGTALASPVRARLREGRRLYSLGYSFSFFFVRCVRRCLERPPLIGSLAALSGFLCAMLGRAPHLLPPDVVSYLRDEQRAKLASFFRMRLGSRPDSCAE